MISDIAPHLYSVRTRPGHSSCLWDGGQGSVQLQITPPTSLGWREKFFHIILDGGGSSISVTRETDLPGVERGGGGGCLLCDITEIRIYVTAGWRCATGNSGATVQVTRL